MGDDISCCVWERGAKTQHAVHVENIFLFIGDAFDDIFKGPYNMPTKTKNGTKIVIQNCL